MSDLYLSVLPSPQRALWDELSSIPEEFVLYGGTAIALQLGHRQSVDFDFFARADIDPLRLIERIDFLAGSESLQLEANTLTVRVHRSGPVLVSFFGVPRLPLLRPPVVHRQAPIALGSLLELGGMKALVVQKRAEAKDYLDIHALLTQAKLDLAELLAAAAQLYGSSFTPEITLKSLCFYDDGNLSTLPNGIRRDLRLAIRSCDPRSLPTL